MRRFTERALIIVLALAVGATIGAVAMKMTSTQPEITISQPETSTNFAVRIPSDKRPAIAEVAKSIGELDLPELLRTKSQKHADIAAAWREEQFDNIAVPFGENIVNVTAMVPHYSSSDPQDRAYVLSADSLNEDLDASILAILEAQVANE